MEKILSEAFLSNATLKELTVVNKYLLSRHMYLMKYQEYDLVGPIAEAMDDIQKTIFSRVSSNDFGKVSIFQP